MFTVSWGGWGIKRRKQQLTLTVSWGGWGIKN